MINMSDALIGCQPRIDEPSKPMPSSNSASSRRHAGIVVCCHTPGKSMNLRSTNLTSCFFASSMASLGVISDCFLSTFAGADAHRLFDGRNEDLAVADASRLGALLHGIEDVVHELVGDDDLDLHLRHEVDDVRRPAVDLFLPAGATEALHFGHGHPLNADLTEGVLDLVELE